MIPSDGGALLSRLAALGAFILLSLAPALSRAAEADEAGARALFVEARKLVDNGNYAEACAKFEDSLRLDPGIGTNFNLADCLEHLGRPASAWIRFMNVAAATRAAGQQEREQVARARADALAPKLAHVIVQVRSPAEGLVVKRDDVEVPPSSWGISVPVDPGIHLIEATAPGRNGWSKRAIVPDGPITVSVEIPPLGPSTPLEQWASGADGAKPPVPQPRRWNVPVIATAAVATAALATAVVYLFKFQSRNEEAKSLCPLNTCGDLAEKARHDTLVSEATRDRTVALASAGIAALALGAAAYLWWGVSTTRATGGTPSQQSARVLLSPVVDGRQFGAVANLIMRW